MNRLLGMLQASIIAAMMMLAFAFPVQAGDVNVAATTETNGRVRLMVRWQSEMGIAAGPAATYAMDTYQVWPLDWQIVEVDAADAPALLADLHNDPRRPIVTADIPLELAYRPDDPAFGDGSQWGLEKVGADIAWEFSRGQAITVAIVDSGIDPNHPDLVDQLVPGYDFYSKSEDTTDLCGHGTHVAGIVAATADNGIGIAGIAHHARLMPVKVIDDTCRGTYSRLILGIIYAVEHGARVIVITSGATSEHDGLRDAIRFAREHNVLVVVAAGNRGDEQPFYPGSYEESFTVAGTDPTDNPYARSTHGSQIDVSAPATSIYSTYYSAEHGSTYLHMTGTSMAAPHVGGLAALILASDPNLSVDDLEMILRQTADDLGEPGWDKHFGWGRVNAWRAVAAVSPAAGNIRLGNTRIPVMAAFEGVAVSAELHRDGIGLAWEVEQAGSAHTAVIYRSTVPVFEAAVDIAELPLVAEGSTGNTLVDTQIEDGETYHYWLVQADRTVEMAVSSMISATFNRDATPTDDPQQPNSHSVYLPMAIR